MAWLEVFVEHEDMTLYDMGDDWGWTPVGEFDWKEFLNTYYETYGEKYFAECEDYRIGWD